MTQVLTSKAGKTTLSAVGLTALVLFIAIGATQLFGRGGSAPPSPQGSIYQSGKIVGWGSGVRVSPSDPSALEFEEISNANKLTHRGEFEYDGYLLRITQVRQVRHSQSSSPEMTLVSVVAKIQHRP